MQVSFWYGLPRVQLIANLLFIEEMIASKLSIKADTDERAFVEITVYCTYDFRTDLHKITNPETQADSNMKLCR